MFGPPHSCGVVPASKLLVLAEPTCDCDWDMTGQKAVLSVRFRGARQPRLIAFHLLVQEDYVIESKLIRPGPVEKRDKLLASRK
jgi:hypothetical protein